MKIIKEGQEVPKNRKVFYCKRCNTWFSANHREYFFLSTKYTSPDEVSLAKCFCPECNGMCDEKK